MIYNNCVRVHKNRKHVSVYFTVNIRQRIFLSVIYIYKYICIGLLN